MGKMASRPSLDDERAHADALASKLPTRQSIPPFESLRAFDAVARLGGVRRAAQGLRRNHAVVSRHIRTLESWTGTTLIERTPTGVVLTEDGERYHREILAAIDTIANATIDLMKHGVENCLDIWSMPGFAYQWLMGHLEDFQSKNTDLAIAIRPTRNIPDFDRHEADINILFVPEFAAERRFSSNCNQLEIACSPIIPVASPAYVDQAPKIEKPEDFLEHQLIHEKSYNGWIGWLEAHRISTDADVSGLRLFHGHLTLDAARRGQGIALTNYYVASGDIASGSLVEICLPYSSRSSQPTGSYFFVARADRWDVRSIRRFREWLVDEIRSSGCVALAV